MDIPDGYTKCGVVEAEICSGHPSFTVESGGVLKRTDKQDSNGNDCLSYDCEDDDGGYNL